MKIRVSIVEDKAEFREYLAALIGGADGFACAGAYATGEAGLKSIPLQKPDVVLLDLELPEMSGMELLTRLKAKLNPLEVLVLSINNDPHVIFQALETGASGYLIKPVAPARILEAITEVSHGGAPMSSQIARLVVKFFQQRGRSKRDFENLTRREEELLALASQGYRSKEIASKLGISQRTVGTHFYNIYEKLHVRSRAQAVAKYLER